MHRSITKRVGKRPKARAGESDDLLVTATRMLMSQVGRWYAFGQIGGAGERHDVAPVDAGAAIAGVAEPAVAHRRDPPVGGGGDLDVVGLIALLAHGHEVLLARLDPAHRTGQHPRHVTDQRRFPIEGRLDAERAALIAGRDDANPVGRDPELIRQRQAVDVRTLGRDPRCEIAVGLPDRERAAGLERRHAGAVDAKASPHHDIGLVDQRLDLCGVARLVFRVIAARERAAEHQVVVPVLVDERRVGPERGPRHPRPPGSGS